MSKAGAGGPDYFESVEAVERSLLYHYGTPEQGCAIHPEARKFWGFTVHCITEPLRHVSLQNHRRALDLGCATGRSTFELGRSFDKVVGIDRSYALISAAQEMQRRRSIRTSVHREGRNEETITLTLPADLVTEKIEFSQGDACALSADIGTFDFVVLTQLIDRVLDPARCLTRLPALVESGGWLVLTSCCNWKEEFTPHDKWLNDGRPGIIEPAKQYLTPFFALRHSFHLQYFIRERLHWYEWSIAEVSIWQRT
jgi:putative 4-mercaptohistidine N1-methyltranferase